MIRPCVLGDKQLIAVERDGDGWTLTAVHHRGDDDTLAAHVDETTARRILADADVRHRDINRILGPESETP